MPMFVANWMNITELVPLLVREGFGIEIQDFCDPTRLDDREYLERLQTAIAPIASRTLHGPYSELVPVSRDPEIRAVTLKRFNSAYALARELQATHLILHSGFIPKTYPPERWLQNACDFWAKFLADKQDAIDIHIENVYEDRFDLLHALIDRLAHPHVSICLDIGHVNANSSLALEAWITGLGNRIRYVHLHNNYGVLDDHFGLWCGTIDMPHTLKSLLALAPQPILCLETIVDDLAHSIDWWRFSSGL